MVWFFFSCLVELGVGNVTYKVGALAMRIYDSSSWPGLWDFIREFANLGFLESKKPQSKWTIMELIG